MKQKGKCTQGVVRTAGTLVLLVILALTAGLALAGFVVQVALRAPETVRFTILLEDGVLSGAAQALRLALGTALVLAVMLGLYRLLVRLRVRGMGVLLLVWAVLTGLFVLLSGVQQMADFGNVLSAAKQFAAGNYDALRGDYLNACSYQLGICLVLEGIARLVPFADLNLLMQCFNGVLSAAAVGLLAALARVISGEREPGAATLAAALLCLPMALYCVYVYGTLPMLCACAGAFLCFALYIRRRRRKYALSCAALMAVGYLLKPNTAIVLAALVLCALFDAIQSRDWRLLLCTLLGAALGAALSKWAILQYELRSGIALREDVGMLARFVMGLPDGGPDSRGPGWYNGYVEQFFPASVSQLQQQEIAAADLNARMGYMAAHPVDTVIFVVRKLLSQWLEPTYSTLLYGNACTLNGRLGEAISMGIYSEQSAVRAVLEGIMKCWQQAFYVLCAVGAASSLKRREDVAQWIVPVTVLGGLLYHLLFEAKSQYIYVYMMYLLPMAGQGLHALFCTLHGFGKNHLTEEMNR